ncbi:NOTC2-like protein [Mya arenaria]|uniref:NOTC2-like protein n=1 Tax=Mya arenaria TaxID=6604 RepID=A0ABY7FNG4_MYAAR|nr:NOTC2-like protein [Mya arenaria]
MCGQHGYAETVNVDDYRCICASGWTHISEKSVCDIDIDECQQGDVCSDKGICYNTEGSYACVCLSGWGGANCSTYNCTVRACKNGGTCVDGRCICTKNWTDNDCSSYVPTDTDSLVPGNGQFPRIERCGRWTKMAGFNGVGVATAKELREEKPCLLTGLQVVVRKMHVYTG